MSEGAHVLAEQRITESLNFNMQTKLDLKPVTE